MAGCILSTGTGRKTLWEAYGLLRTRNPDYVVETDASLGGVGIILYKGQSLDTCLGGSAVSIKGFGFGIDSSFQNTAEYIGMVLGILALVKMGVRDVDVLIRGDSTTALSWVTEGRIKGPHAVNAAVVVTSLYIRFGIRPRYSVFLAGLDNHKADLLSRIEEKGITVEQAMTENGHGYAPIIDLRDNPSTDVLIRMCDPKVRIEHEDEFTMLWQTVREAMETIVRVFRPTAGSSSERVFDVKRNLPQETYPTVD